jgi:hypothetical protein
MNSPTQCNTDAAKAEMKPAKRQTLDEKLEAISKLDAPARAAAVRSLYAAVLSAGALCYRSDSD